MLIMRLFLRKSLNSPPQTEQEKMFRDRRRRFIVKPRLQFKIAFITLLSITLAVVISFGVFYFFAVEELVQFNHPRVPIILERLRYALLASFGISSAAVVLAVIYLTHKIAGPLYRFEKSMEAVGRGDLTHVVKTRKGDELKDLEEAFNEMIISLREKVINGEILITANKDSAPRCRCGKISNGK